MANIDTSTIEGFEGMTAEQKVDALLKLNIPDAPDMSKFISKDTFDKTASELAKTKKEYAAKLSDDEKAKIAEKEKWDELQSKYDALEKSSKISESTAKYIGLGYDEKLAKETAEALYEGNMEKVFANQKAFNEAQEKAIRAKLVAGDPKPSGTGGGGDDKSEAVKLAESLAKNRSNINQKSSDAMKNYFK